MKKSLVGWTYNAWKEHFFFDISPYLQEEIENQRIIETPTIRKYKSTEGGSIIKVKITIETLPTPQRRKK